MNYGSNTNNVQIRQDPSSYQSPISFYENNGDFHAELNKKLNNMGNIHTFTQPISISEHVEVTKPVVVPIVKNIGKIL